MATSKTPRIYTRKEPQQARSTELVEAILTAAVQVLERDGAERFTMKYVAERAGVSIGSLYQYFPNKAAILFRLQCDEWRETSAALFEILEDSSLPPATRVRSLVHAYVRSEVAEAPYRLALDDEAPFYRDLPESEDTRFHVRAALGRFVGALDPAAPDDASRRAADVFATTLSTLGERFSRQERTDEEIRAYAETVADMLCAFTERLAGANDHSSA